MNLHFINSGPAAGPVLIGIRRRGGAAVTPPTDRDDIDYDQIRGEARSGNGPKFQMVDTEIPAGHMAIGSVQGNLVDGGLPSAGGGTPGGTTGQIQYNSSGSFAGFTASGDATINPATGAVAVTKTGGSTFAASATTDATNASNISSGTLPAARLPLGSSSAFGAVKVDGTTITATAGVISAAAAADPVFPTMTPPLAANFTFLNTNSYSVTATDKTSRLLINIPVSALGVALMQTAALPATPYTIDVGFVVHSNFNIIVASLALKANASAPLRSYGPRIDGAGFWYLNDQSWTTVIAPGGQNNTTSAFLLPQQLFFMRITDDGTNRKTYFSTNGKDYELWLSQATGTGLTPDRAGIIFYNNNSSWPMAISVYHWLVSSSVLPQYAA